MNFQSLAMEVPWKKKKRKGEGEMGREMWEQDHFTPARRDNMAVCVPLPSVGSVWAEESSSPRLTLCTVTEEEATESSVAPLERILTDHHISFLFCFVDASREETWSQGVIEKFPTWIDSLSLTVLLMPLMDSDLTLKNDEKVKIILSEIKQALQDGHRVMTLCNLRTPVSSLFIGCALINLGISSGARAAYTLLQEGLPPSIQEALPPPGGEESENWMNRLKPFEQYHYRHLAESRILAVLERIRHERKEEELKAQLVSDLETIYLVSREREQRVTLLTETPLFADLVFRSERAAQLLALSVLSCLIQKREAVEALHANQCVLSLTALLASCALPGAGVGEMDTRAEGDERFAENLLLVLARVVEHSRHAVEFARSGGVSSLLLVLQNTTDIAVKGAAAQVLLRISVWGKEVQVHVRMTEMAEGILPLLRPTPENEEEGEVLAQLCGALQNLCRDDDRNRQVFVSHDGPAVLAQAVSHSTPDSALRPTLLKALSEMCSRSGEIQMAFRHAGVIAMCLAILHDRSAGTKAYQSRLSASQLLQKLTWKNEDNQQQVLDGGGAQVLTNTLQTVTGQEAVIGSALACISNLTSGPNRLAAGKAFHRNGLMQLLTPRFLQALALHMKNDLLGTVYLMDAMTIIGHLANRDFPEGQRELRESNGLDTIVQFLKPGHSSALQLAAAQVVSFACAGNEANAMRIILQGGLAILVPLLESQDAAVLHHALAALVSVLEEDRAGRAQELLQPVLPSIIHALGSGARHVQVEAGRALQLILEHTPAPLQSMQQTYISQGILLPLHHGLESNQRHLVLQVVRLTQVLATHNRGVQEEIRRSAVLPSLVPHLAARRYNSIPFSNEQPRLCPSIQTATLHALTALLVISPGQYHLPMGDAFIKLNAADLCLPLAQQNEEEMVVGALELLYTLAQIHPRTRKAILQADELQIVSLFSFLPGLLGHYEEQIALYALQLVCVLSQDNQTVRKSFEANDIVEVLQRMPASANEMMQSQLRTARSLFGLSSLDTKRA